MLLDRATELQLVEIIKQISSSYSAFLIGRELGQRTIIPASASLGLASPSQWTVMEIAYIAGKLVQTIGYQQARRMSEDQLVNWIRNNQVRLEAYDRIAVRKMQTDTERWVQNRSGVWTERLRSQLVRADSEFVASLTTGRFNDSKGLADLRNGMLAALMARLVSMKGSMVSEVDRLVQTEVNGFFQRGLISGVPGNRYVYKQPRMSACKHCIRICVTPGGGFRKHRLTDVIGASNIGLPAIAWRFTVGPIHPYCYCVLKYVDVQPPRNSKRYAELYEEAISKSVKSNHCGVDDGLDTDHDGILEVEPTHEMPADRLKVMRAVTMANGLN